ncbi:MAG: DinB family protein [Vicinamibacterales bacterium]
MAQMAQMKARATKGPKPEKAGSAATARSSPTSVSESAAGGVTAVLVALLDEAFDRKSWHGTNLRGALRGLAPETAAWRPGRSRHNIWELVVHAAYWKYAVRRRLTGEPKGGFPLKGSNFWVRPEQGDAGEWKRDVALLVSEHKRLCDAVLALPGERLTRKVPGSAFTYAELIRGAAAHDLYHAGQIQLLKRMAQDGLSYASGIP